MASVNWLTYERIRVLWFVVIGFIFFVLGLSGTTTTIIFGVNAYLWLSLIAFIVAFLLWVEQHM